jgi:hypothetical protein
MPYIIRPPRFRVSTVAAVSALLAFGAASAQASTASVDTSQCTTPALTQPFLYTGDSSYYMLPAGELPNAFEGGGWTLSGGASIKQTTIADGTTSTVLDLPSGSKAVSPTLCVDVEYPIARTMVRNVVGSEGVYFYVSYAGTKSATTPKNIGQVHGTGTAWTLSGRVNMQPENTAGWQLVKISLVPGGKTSDFQIYNLYVDPYKR